MIPGDNEISLDSIRAMYRKVLQEKADIVIPYTLNYWIRPFLRRFLSCTFTKSLNLLFNLKLNYYNGPVIYKRELIKSAGLTTNSFAFQAEALIKLIKSGYSFNEVGMYIEKRPFGKSKALRLRNLLGVLKTIFVLFINVRILRKRLK